MSEVKTEDQTKDTTKEDDDSPLDDELEPKPDQEKDDGEGKGDDQEKKEEKSEEDSEEVEVVREVKGSEPTKKTKSFTNRIMKLKGESQQETERADKKEQENVILREQMKLKDLALQQAKNQKPAAVRPNPDDFDEGYNDPKFIEKNDDFYDQRADQRMDKKFSEFSQTQTDTVSKDTNDRELDRALNAYMEKADKTCPKDHSDKETAVVEILGNQTVNDIIKNWDDAPLIIHYLGTNKDEAESLRDLIKRNPVKGVARIERLLTEISFKPKNNKNDALEPDDELPGGSATGGKRGPKGATYE